MCIIEVSFLGVIPRLVFFGPAALEDERQAKVVACHVTLIPCHLEERMIAARETVHAAKWTTEKREYVREQIGIIQRECELAGIPKLHWEEPELIDKKCE